ncbi:hypothetical protein TVAG_395660 [Trichomonas vaginalis G3]|uniref:Bromo domain-containing protein n=1 Tax=Trichomonas vaginalis (strain ATCC PRA-98 / G3) TaxID=412133 RepID=A2FX42_TRIV3|nr:bromodomain family [Trichomonas vaginalis G3]EAX90520.1 hypothetical protein TVAG_395660 [Trichomonas vaginalis G3]KAI5483770.1 bromodomain family [Trichomonas vaginalis G3]|eukprot:XP_001303450.1 hypothetical protein [Trichomonas vaginalis G3]
MSSKLEEYGWTPALIQMAIEVIDKIIARPLSLYVSDPRNGSLNTLQGIREKLSKKKYSNLPEWKNEVLAVFKAAKTSDNKLQTDISEELTQYFEKKYAVLEELSLFKFRTAITRVVDEMSATIAVNEDL